MTKIVCVGGGQAKGVPEVRPTWPERIPALDDLLKLTLRVEACQDYAQVVECMSGSRSKNWRRIVNDSRVAANKVHRELNKACTKWRKLG